jgi:uncharacterized metal-binding protein YceD (DUF177 family)
MSSFHVDNYKKILDYLVIKRVCSIHIYIDIYASMSTVLPRSRCTRPVEGGLFALQMTNCRTVDNAVTSLTQ